MERVAAAVGIIWIFLTMYLTFQAVKDGYPVYFGIVASSAVVGLAILLQFLVGVAFG